MYRTTVAIQINCRISNSDSIMTFLSILSSGLNFRGLFLFVLKTSFDVRRSWESSVHRSFSRRETKKRRRRSFLLITTVPNGIQNQARLAVRIQIGRFIPESTSSKDTVTKKRLEQNLQNNCCTVFRHQKEGKLSFFSFLEILNPELKVKNSSFKLPKINYRSLSHFVNSS